MKLALAARGETLRRTENGEAPGLEMVVEIDPDGTLDPELGWRRVFRPMGGRRWMCARCRNWI